MASYLGRPTRSRTARLTRLRSGAVAGGRTERVDKSKVEARLREKRSTARKKQPYSLHNPITMQQRIQIEQTPKRPSIWRRLLPVVVLALAVAVVTDPLVSTASRVYNSVVQDQYALYRARLGQLNLQAANARMRSELISLRSRQTKEGETRENVLTQKIAELESLIESVTALGVFHGRKSRLGESLVSKGTPSKTRGGELAAILHSPQLAGASAKGDVADKENGIGGAEEPCDGHSHVEEAHKEDVALLDESTSVHDDIAQDPVNSARQQLLTRINRFISVVQVLPLGSPVQGHLSSGFGHRRSPFSNRGSFHYGVDISLKVGSKVMATGAGKVVKVAHNRTYGTLVDIQHAPGLVTRYAHLSKVYVHAGQEVQRGTAIALSGNTGRSTGPHLHYEVRHNGKARNPTPFVQLAGRLSEFVGLDGRIL
jgi:hypothetical protein